MMCARWITLICLLVNLPAFADDGVTTSVPTADVTAPETAATDVLAPDVLTASVAALDAVSSKSSWLLVACGLPGDDDHRQRLSTAVERIMTAGTSVLQIPSEHVIGLVGDDAMQSMLETNLDQTLQVCTRESFADAVAKLCEVVPADADCWIILLGHADLYDGKSRFNVQGPDWDQAEMATWLKPLRAERQIIFVSTPVSGFWLKPLSGSNRIVISATEADQEFTGTEMPYALADVLAGQGEHEQLRDIDGDGAISLFDLYVVVNLEIHERFRSLERLQTEHAQLEDNGDGRGSEVQTPYLPIDEDDAGESAPVEDDAQFSETKAEPTATPKLIMSESMDGYRSRQVLLKKSTQE